jgi:hypothetical protein
MDSRRGKRHDGNYPAVTVAYQFPAGLPSNVTLPARATDSPGYTDTNIDPGGSWSIVRVTYGATVLNTISNTHTTC